MYRILYLLHHIKEKLLIWKFKESFKDNLFTFLHQGTFKIRKLISVFSIQWRIQFLWKLCGIVNSDCISTGLVILKRSSSLSDT